VYIPLVAAAEWSRLLVYKKKSDFKDEGGEGT
jgi:hypothetical protein